MKSACRASYLLCTADCRSAISSSPVSEFADCTVPDKHTFETQAIVAVRSVCH
jgi:hypothetical protein